MKRATFQWQIIAIEDQIFAHRNYKQLSNTKKCVTSMVPTNNVENHCHPCKMTKQTK